MLRRFLLALLIACLAAPAMAAPAVHAPQHRHHAPAAMAMHEHHAALPATGEDESGCGVQHQCIGCVARYDGVTVPAAPIVLPVARAIPDPTAPPAAAHSGPATPPPRC